MDEDLQTELLQILRELKNGATPAFQELVAQRSSYCMAMAFGTAVAAWMAVAAMAVFLRLAPRIEDEEMRGIASRACVALGALSAIICFAQAYDYLMQAWFPLASVLEVR